MEKFRKLTEKLESFLKMGIPFYDCIIMKDGRCVYRHANGYTDINKKISVTGKELYNIYSCSKLITCVAALQLFEKGLFKLDDELCSYMPEFENMTIISDAKTVPAKNKITIRQLFTMTAGFSYDLNSPMLKKCRKETNGECATLKTMKYLAKEPLLFEPGYRWEYSLCHDVLAALVEVITGMTFDEYVKKNIFDVSAMEHSTFNLPNNELDRMCPQYRYNPVNKTIEICSKSNGYKLGTKYESGGAGCISTVEDYMKFLEAVRMYKLIKKETVDLLATNQLTDEQRAMPTYWVREKRGYGLGQQCPVNENMRSDFGWGGAAGAHYFIDRSKGISTYLGTHILGFEKYQVARCDITPIIQEIF